jgi:hypothetical protein
LCAYSVQSTYQQDIFIVEKLYSGKKTNKIKLLEDNYYYKERKWRKNQEKRNGVNIPRNRNAKVFKTKRRGWLLKVSGGFKDFTL